MDVLRVVGELQCLARGLLSATGFCGMLLGAVFPGLPKPALHIFSEVSPWGGHAMEVEGAKKPQKYICASSGPAWSS